MARRAKAADAFIGESAARARIRDLEGGEVDLQELWADRTAVLVFLRHFG